MRSDTKIATHRLMGIRVDDVAIDTLLDEIVDGVRERRRTLVVNANAQLINLSFRHPWLVDLFDRATVAFCDGAGVQFALWWQTGRRPSRHTPPQWIMPLAKRLAREDATVFWLGGNAEAVEKAARQLEAQTGLRAVGWHHGYFDHSAGSHENDLVVEEINRLRPDLVLVNLGMPLQERWLSDNWHRLDATVAITGGALVDHIAGRVRRPPLWVANAGLEWLVRLAIEPRRLWRRYVIGLPVFGLRLLTYSGHARRGEPPILRTRDKGDHADA